MYNQEQSNRQLSFTGRYYAREEALYTVKRYLLLLAVAAVVISVPSWLAWRSYMNILTIETQLEQLIRAEGTTMYRDELLAMSARMAAATRNKEWASRNQKYGPRIEATIQELRHIFESDTTDAENAEEGLMVYVDDGLDAMEARALELVQGGYYDRAADILRSAEYEQQRQAYSSGMKAFIDNACSVLEGRRDRQRQIFIGSVAAVGLFTAVCAVSWFVVHKKRRASYERVQTKQKLNAFARKWYETFNAITDGVCIIDRSEGKIIQCNSAMTQFLKRPYKEIIGRKCCELLHNSSEPVKRCPLVRMYQSRRSETRDFEIGDKWLNIKADPLLNKEGELVGAVHIISDITEQRRADRAVRESENKFRLAFANAQDAIVWIDAGSGVITNCNRAAEELFAKTRKEIVGEHHTALYPAEDVELRRGLFVGSREESQGNVEAEIQTGGGETRTVTIAVSRMEVDGTEIAQGIIRDITESKRALDEIENLAKFPSEDPHPVLRISNECEVIYANEAGSPVLKSWQIEEGGRHPPEAWCNRIKEVYASGERATYELDCEGGRTFFITLQPIVEAGYVNAYGLDITKLKKAEKEKMELELQLSRKQKMEAVGTLAGGIAHDFNNILGAMQGYLELSLDDLPEDSIVREHLEQIVSCVGRAAKLVKQILTFSRKDQQEQEKEPVQVSCIVKEVLGMLRSSLPATIKISRKIHADSSIVMADSTQLHQVLVNLCTNASHAMRENGGLLEVGLEDVELSAETRVGDEYVPAGGYVKLRVSDTGHGIEEEVLERVFEPFFTTKGLNEGTGLGLSVVHGIIKSHNGAIAVSSRPGEGTTFEIFLPRMESGDLKGGGSSQPAAKDSELILLVDDEEMIISSTKKILERLGFEVVAKTSSVDALEAFQEEPEKYDVVFTDQVMPNMTGTQLSEKLLSVRPDIPIILCSVFPEDVDPEQIKRIGIKEFIAKPISMQKINKIIRKVLDKSGVTV
jgi:PAS domain S-box-containing protein